MFRSFLFSLILVTALAALCSGQTTNLCVTSKPKPALPPDYGTLDGVTSVIFGVVFMADGQIGKVSLVKSAHIQRLDDLALDAVKKIKFVLKMVDGSPVAVFKTVRYSYSWEYGWRGPKLSGQQSCKSMPINAKTKRAKFHSKP